MKRIAVLAVISAGVAALLHGSVSDPASWALVLAAVACGGLLAGRPRPPIGIEG